MLEPVVDGIYSANTAIGTNKGFPGDVVMAEGEDFQNIKTIIFDETIEVLFNPVFNSNLAISFSVPFDEAKGSKFGSQKITFTNEDGTIFQSDFDILQPKPSPWPVIPPRFCAFAEITPFKYVIFIKP